MLPIKKNLRFLCWDVVYAGGISLMDDVCQKSQYRREKRALNFFTYKKKRALNFFY